MIFIYHKMAKPVDWSSLLLDILQKA